MEFTMDETLSELLPGIKKSCSEGVFHFSKRGLHHTASWLSEVAASLSDVNVEDLNTNISYDEIDPNEFDAYILAYSYFIDQEYDRCAHYTKNKQTKICQFLKYYSRYMSLEFKRLNHVTDDSLFSETVEYPNYYEDMKDLCNELKMEYVNSNLDCFSLYVYGIVLKRLQLNADARDVLIESLHLEPLHWGAWLELVPLISNLEMYNSLVIPDHWIKSFFLGYLFLDMQLYDKAKDVFEKIVNSGFRNFSLINVQVAFCKDRLGDMDEAEKDLKVVMKVDPYRLDAMEVYSNVLYMKDDRSSLAKLALFATEVDKERVESCCVVGSYYSLRGDHNKAILYFQKAVKLNPRFVSAWTLMGHEYMELKNIGGANLSYRKALATNNRDFRAWFGVGQTYDIFKLPFFALYYYKSALLLRPAESRIYVAMGEIYEKLDRIQEAFKCLFQARRMRNATPIVIIKLARLYQRVDDKENAAKMYEEVVKDKNKIYSGSYFNEYQNACTFLGNYFVECKDADKLLYYMKNLARYPRLNDEFRKAIKKRAEPLENVRLTSGLDRPNSKLKLILDALEQNGEKTVTPKDICIALMSDNAVTHLKQNIAAMAHRADGVLRLRTSLEGVTDTSGQTEREQTNITRFLNDARLMEITTRVVLEQARRDQEWIDAVGGLPESRSAHDPSRTQSGSATQMIRSPVLLQTPTVLTRPYTAPSYRSSTSQAGRSTPSVSTSRTSSTVSPQAQPAQLTRLENQAETESSIEPNQTVHVTPQSLTRSDNPADSQGQVQQPPSGSTVSRSLANDLSQLAFQHTQIPSYQEMNNQVLTPIYQQPNSVPQQHIPPSESPQTHQSYLQSPSATEGQQTVRNQTEIIVQPVIHQVPSSIVPSYRQSPYRQVIPYRPSHLTQIQIATTPYNRSPVLPRPPTYQVPYQRMPQATYMRLYTSQQPRTPMQTQISIQLPQRYGVQVIPQRLTSLPGIASLTPTIQRPSNLSPVSYQSYQQSPSQQHNIQHQSSAQPHPSMTPSQTEQLLNESSNTTPQSEQSLS